jgi:hypothetical protein
MPFLQPLEDYKPPSSKSDQGPSAPQVLKKPAKIREEAENRNKQLLEGAFHGTLHLHVCLFE